MLTSLLNAVNLWRGHLRIHLLSFQLVKYLARLMLKLAGSREIAFLLSQVSCQYKHMPSTAEKMAKKGIFMKYIVLIMCLLIDINVHAAEMPAIAKDHCGGCHAVEKKLYAPSLKEIATKYRGDADAVKKLTENINGGGAFGWNSDVKMPARGLNANDKEIKAMVEFIVDLSNVDSCSKVKCNSQLSLGAVNDTTALR